MLDLNAPTSQAERTKRNNTILKPYELRWCSSCKCGLPIPSFGVTSTKNRVHFQPCCKPCQAKQTLRRSRLKRWLVIKDRPGHRISEKVYMHRCIKPALREVALVAIEALETETGPVKFCRGCMTVKPVGKFALKGLRSHRKSKCEECLAPYYASKNRDRKDKKKESILEHVIVAGGYKCYLCEIDVSDGSYQIDHKTPRCRGGSNRLENLGLSCISCNQLKGLLTEEEFRRVLAPVGRIGYVSPCTR